MTNNSTALVIDYDTKRQQLSYLITNEKERQFLISFDDYYDLRINTFLYDTIDLGFSDLFKKGLELLKTVKRSDVFLFALEEHFISAAQKHKNIPEMLQMFLDFDVQELTSPNELYHWHINYNKILSSPQLRFVMIKFIEIYRLEHKVSCIEFKRYLVAKHFLKENEESTKDFNHNYLCDPNLMHIVCRFLFLDEDEHEQELTFHQKCYNFAKSFF